MEHANSSRKPIKVKKKKEVMEKWVKAWTSREPGFWVAKPALSERNKHGVPCCHLKYAVGLAGQTVALGTLPQSSVLTLTQKHPHLGRKRPAPCHHVPEGGALDLLEMVYLLPPGPFPNLAKFRFKHGDEQANEVFTIKLSC